MFTCIWFAPLKQPRKCLGALPLNWDSIFSNVSPNCGVLCRQRVWHHYGSQQFVGHMMWPFSIIDWGLWTVLSPRAHSADVLEFLYKGADPRSGMEGRRVNGPSVVSAAGESLHCVVQGCLVASTCTSDFVAHQTCDIAASGGFQPQNCWCLWPGMFCWVGGCPVHCVILVAPP